jgi:RimJ/RimL family protein N-acetyltransferase
MGFVELEASDFPEVLPLYQSSSLRFPLISAVIENRQRGQVFVDRNGKSALVVNNFGFMYLIGAEVNPELHDALVGLFSGANRIKPSYLLWYSPPESWQQRLDAAGARRRERIRYEFQERNAGYLSEPVTCPSGFDMRRLDTELIPSTKKFGIEIDSRFWASARDVTENGLGFCIIKDDDVVSICYAAAISDGLAEIDVATDEAYRQQGLAVLVSQQFIRECLSRGITPTWDCFAYNTGSRRLAERLGFSELVHYPFYSFNIPLTLDHGD